MTHLNVWVLQQSHSERECSHLSQEHSRHQKLILLLEEASFVTPHAHTFPVLDEPHACTTQAFVQPCNELGKELIPGKHSQSQASSCPADKLTLAPLRCQCNCSISCPVPAWHRVVQQLNERLGSKTLLSELLLASSAHSSTAADSRVACA